MSTIRSNPFPNQELAEHVVQQLVDRGVPLQNVVVRNELPPQGLNLGAGVPVDAALAIVEQHENETAEPGEGGYVVEVDTQGDMLNESATREVFGQI